MMYKAKNLWLFYYVAIVLLFPLDIVFADEGKSDNDNKTDIKIFIGYSWYNMKE